MRMIRIYSLHLTISIRAIETFSSKTQTKEAALRLSPPPIKRFHLLLLIIKITHII